VRGVNLTPLRENGWTFHLWEHNGDGCWICLLTQKAYSTLKALQVEIERQEEKLK
jgi:hypothetical protein